VDDGAVDSPITNLALNVRQSSSLSDSITSSSSEFPSSSSSEFALKIVASMMCDLRNWLDVMVTDDGANENAEDV